MKPYMRLILLLCGVFLVGVLIGLLMGCDTHRHKHYNIIGPADSDTCVVVPPPKHRHGRGPKGS